MPPTSILGQISQSMASGQSPLNSISSSSPAFQPGLTPPSVPMPDKSPASFIHRAAGRRGMDLSNHPQLQANFAQSPTPGAPVNSDPSSFTNPQQATLPIQDQNPQQPGVQVPISEAELIVKALNKRLDHHTKMTEKLMNTMLPEQQPQNNG